MSPALMTLFHCEADCDDMLRLVIKCVIWRMSPGPLVAVCIISFIHHSELHPANVECFLKPWRSPGSNANMRHSSSDNQDILLFNTKKRVVNQTSKNKCSNFKTILRLLPANHPVHADQMMFSTSEYVSLHLPRSFQLIWANYENQLVRVW